MTGDFKRLKPEVGIRLDGQEVAPEVAGSIEAVRLYLSRESASAFELIVNDERRRGSEASPLCDAHEIEILLGYEGRLTRVFSGEITAWRVELERDGPDVLVVRGMDRAHRLMLGQKTRTFSAARTADVVAQVARENGLAARIGPDTIELDHCVQANETDFDFLRRLAELEGCELFVEGRTLHFERPSAAGGELRFVFGEGIEVFTPVIDYRAPLSEVEVRGWDPATRSAVVQVAREGVEAVELAGRQRGSALARFGATTPKLVSSDYALDAAEEASARARSIRARRSMEFLTAEVEVPGNAAVVPGQIVRVDKVGPLYSGRYYVREANHFFDAAGYTTIFHVVRDRLFEASARQ